MKSRRSVIPTAVILFASTLQAAYADGNSWHMANLFEPSPAQVKREQAQRVMIYHGMKDTDIDRAMDEQFDRIEAMMFTGTIVTDDKGQPLRDPTTGDIVSNNLAEEVNANTADIDQLTTQVDDIEDDIDWEQP
jgi:hypothetical protein